MFFKFLFTSRWPKDGSLETKHVANCVLIDCVCVVFVWINFFILYRMILSLEAPNYCLMRNTGKCKSLVYRMILSLEAPNYCLMRNTGKCKSLGESNISWGSPWRHVYINF